MNAARQISESSALRKGRSSRASIGLKKIPRILKPRKCNNCGALVDIWPCLICHPSGGMPDSTRLVLGPRVIEATRILKANVTELIRVSQDVLNLNEMEIECFNNPLFCALVSRADRVLRKIKVKQGEFVDVKFK